MKLYKLSLNETKTFLSTLKCDKSGVAIMSKKAKVHTLFIKDLHVGAANILKQDALSFAIITPSGTAKSAPIERASCFRIFAAPT